MSAQDTALTAITAWKENRGGGHAGMQSVCNVIVNNAHKTHRTLYAECLFPNRYSSMTVRSDPQYGKWAPENDPQWIDALQLAAAADAGELPDITGGATNYYASSLDPPPAWAAKMTPTVEISGQKFYK